NAFAISANPFAISANPFAISANPFAISANPFAISANPFAISANPFAISAIAFVISANPFVISANPFVISALGTARTYPYLGKILKIICSFAVVEYFSHGLTIQSLYKFIGAIISTQSLICTVDLLQKPLNHPSPTLPDVLGRGLRKIPNNYE
ncbi:MAG: hypothetical protein HWQ58_02040, partial [Nostoc sp. LPT]|nr:hypothetical protein [Nostoc sp. LPT]